MNAFAELKQLFERMDDPADETALAAMVDCKDRLAAHGLSFGRVVEQLEPMLLPRKIISVLKMLDGSPGEACNALRAARRMLSGAGLSFSALIKAIEQHGHATLEVDRLTRALGDARSVAARHAAELMRLRAEVIELRTRRLPSHSPWRRWAVLAALALVSLWISGSLTNGLRSPAVAAAAAAAAPSFDARGVTSAPARARQPVRCWRDRSISGPCF
jgi:hypothetical protein